MTRLTYEMWTYWGEVDHDDLESAGVGVGEKDELRTVSACVVMINNTVVKAFLNPLEGGDIHRIADIQNGPSPPVVRPDRSQERRQFRTQGLGLSIAK